MATIKTVQLIENLLLNNGAYADVRYVTSVYSFVTQRGEQVYEIFTDESNNNLYRNPNVRQPKLLWSRDQGLTAEGMNFLQGRSDSRRAPTAFQTTIE